MRPQQLEHLSTTTAKQRFISSDHVRQPDDATLVADRILAALTAPFELQGQQVTISASIGIAKGDAAFESAEEILCGADKAMYAAKTRGRAQHVLFEAL